MLKKLKNEAIARGLTESPAEKYAKQQTNSGIFLKFYLFLKFFVGNLPDLVVSTQSSKEEVCIEIVLLSFADCL